MKQLLSEKFQKEIELEKPSRSIWETIFRIGGSVLLILTVVGGILEGTLGKGEETIPPFWIWALTIVYLTLLAYCFNYMVIRYVKNPFIKWTWLSIMGLFAIGFTVDYLTK